MMDNIGLWIYLSGMLDNMGKLFTGLAIFAAVCLFVLLLFIGIAFVNDDLTEDISKKLYSVVRNLVIIFAISAPISAVIPSQKTIAAMIVVPAIVNNEDISGIAADSLKGFRILAGEWVKELAENTKEKE